MSSRSLAGIRNLRGRLKNRLVQNYAVGMGAPAMVGSQRTITPRKVSSRHYSSLFQKSTCSVPARFAPHICNRNFGGGRVTKNDDGSINFDLADIGEGIAEVEIMQWFVKPGDKIEQFDKIVEVQSDKATVEITSRYDGTVGKLCGEVGEMTAVGAPLVTIFLEGEEAAAAAAETGQESSPPPTSSSASPSSSASIDAVKQGDGLPIRPFRSGPPPTTEGGRPAASPAVRRLAAENDVDLTLIMGTGPNNRITKEDVLVFIGGGSQTHQPATLQNSGADQSAQGQAPPSGLGAPVAAQAALPAGEDREVKVTGLQRIMVKTMNQANQIPSFVYSDEIIMDNLMAVRAQLKPLAEARGIKLTPLPFIIKATSLALLEYPSLNAYVNEDCTAVTHKAAHNIGTAVDSPRGLVVPNIKNVQSLSVLEIAQELNRLVATAAAGKLGPQDLQGGTFTLSNIGAIGGTYCVPLLVVPQVAIGALGKSVTVPRYNDKMEAVPTTVMNAGWTADHRVLDGATVARFSNLWKSYMEDPTLMLASLR